MNHFKERKIHDLPCWDHESCGGRTSASYFPPEKDKNDGHLYCFKCTQTLWDQDVIDEHLYLYSNLYNMGSKNYLKRKRVKDMDDQKDTIKDLFFKSREKITFKQNEGILERGLTKASCSKYSVEGVYLDDKKIGYAYSSVDFSKDQEDIDHLFAKARKIKFIKDPNQNSKKQMTIEGDITKTGFFGMDVVPQGGKYITITEGEEDCIATYQMLKAQNSNYEPLVVSVNNGAGSALREFKRHWEWLNSFEQIIICFDSDSEGKKAAVACADLFPNKARIVKLGNTHKDANEFLLSGNQRMFVDLWYKAERFTPEGVIPSSNLWTSMLEVENNISVPYPWKGLNEKLYGLRTGELVVVKAAPKIGKTQFLRELAYHIKTTSPHNVGLLYLEETLKRIGLGMCSFHLNKPLQIPTTEYTEDELRLAYENVLGDDRFFIFDPKASRTVENIMTKITHFAKAYDCKYIFLDHVSMLTYTSQEEQERRLLDRVLCLLKDLTVELGVSIVCVQHVNDEGKTRGSRAAYQLCDALLDLNRKKLSECDIEANTTVVTVEENRISGESGIACRLYYDRETGRMTELESPLSDDPNNDEKDPINSKADLDKFFK